MSYDTTVECDYCGAKSGDGYDQEQFELQQAAAKALIQRGRAEVLAEVWKLREWLESQEQKAYSTVGKLAMRAALAELDAHFPKAKE